MSILNSRKSRSNEWADSGRRSFFRNLGAGLSTALVSTAGLAKTDGGTLDASSLRVALLEEEKSLRKLHQAYEGAMDKGLYEEAVGMFANEAEVLFDGEVFSHRSQGVSWLYREYFRSGKTGGRMEPAPGFEIDGKRQQDRVEISPDRLSANAVFPYSIQVGIPIDLETSLASMARLQGEGVRTWWEGGVYHVSYRKDGAAGTWKISRLEYKTLSRADYRSGRSYAKPISVPRFSRARLRA